MHQFLGGTRLFVIFRRWFIQFIGSSKGYDVLENFLHLKFVMKDIKYIRQHLTYYSYQQISSKLRLPHSDLNYNLWSMIARILNLFPSSLWSGNAELRVFHQIHPYPDSSYNVRRRKSYGEVRAFARGRRCNLTFLRQWKLVSVVADVASHEMTERSDLLLNFSADGAVPDARNDIICLRDARSRIGRTTNN